MDGIRQTRRLTLLLLLTASAGATVRDPLQAPAAAAQAAAPADPGAPRAAGADPMPRHIVVIDGRRWVLDGAKRFGPGDRWGEHRIECIHDDAVTVRDAGGQRRRLPLFPSVQIRPTGTTTAPGCPGAAPSVTSRTPAKALR
jgi:hypothetical protein